MENHLVNLVKNVKSTTKYKAIFLPLFLKKRNAIWRKSRQKKAIAHKKCNRQVCCADHQEAVVASVGSEASSVDS